MDILIKLAGALKVDMEDVFIVSHEESDPKKLRSMADLLLKEADVERLRLVVKILRGVLH